MNQDQLNGIVSAVVQAVVKTLVEQITPIVVEQVKQEMTASMAGVLAMDAEALAEPVLRLLQNNVAIQLQARHRGLVRVTCQTCG